MAPKDRNSAAQRLLERTKIGIARKRLLSIDLQIARGGPDLEELRGEADALVAKIDGATHWLIEEEIAEWS